jgi:methyl-accepting chemotaxis protein
MKRILMNLPMKKKLFLSPLVVILFLIVFGAVSYIGLSNQKAAINDIFNIRFKSYQNSAKIANDISNVHSNVYKVLSWTSTSNESNKIDALGKEQIISIESSMAAIDKILNSSRLSQEEKKRYQAIHESLKAYKGAVVKVVDMASADFNLATILMKATDDQFLALNKGLREASELENRLSTESYDFSLKTFNRVLVVLGAVMCIAVALSLCVSVFMTRLILAPIDRTVVVTEEISQGDLTKRIDVLSSDEVGEMAGHFDTFVGKLNQTISQVAQNISKVSSAANTLDRAAEQMATGIEQIVSQVNSVATSSEEMSTTSSEIAQNCIMAAKSSENANDSALTGENIIQKTISIMNHINERVQGSAKIIENLGLRSEQIGEVVDLINDIADQTNLLALNAAIEAARAGEHGRGFAVVADEVRKLAERTTDATKEIGQTIAAIQSGTREAVASMEEGVKEVNLGAEEAGKSGAALKDILLQIRTVTSEVSQIATASEQQTATTNEIANNIQQISEVMRETSKKIQENAGAASQLASLSQELQTVVSQFKL